MTRILITGANGHIGANTVREALEKGYEVVAMVRETSDLRGLEGLTITKAIGDIRDKDAVRRAADGCEAVIHLATPYEVWGIDDHEIMDSALQGTRNIFEVGHEVGISRMVYTSSAISIGLSDDPNRVRSVDHWNEDGGHTAYAHAKNDGERAAWQLAEQYSIPTLAFCPTFVVGRYDYRITPSTRLLLSMIEGRQPTYLGSFNIVDVRDVSYVLVAALSSGTPGERYILGGDSLMAREWGNLITQLTGIKIMYVPGPRFVALALGSIDEFFSGLVNRRPNFMRGTSEDMYMRYQNLDCSATYDAFGYTPRDGVTAVQATINWLLSIDAFTPRTAQKIRQHQAQMTSA